MRNVIRDGQVAQDHWLYIEDDADLPTSGDFFVSLARWQDDSTALNTYDGQVGVYADGDVDFEQLVNVSSQVAAISLRFNKFADGRSYSHAHLLRTRHNFTGDLRASGDILRDQMFYLNRCGFNVLEVREDKDIDAATASLADFSITYQPAADGGEPIYAKDRPDA